MANEVNAREVMVSTLHKTPSRFGFTFHLTSGRVESVEYKKKKNTRFQFFMSNIFNVKRKYIKNAIGFDCRTGAQLVIFKNLPLTV